MPLYLRRGAKVKRLHIHDVGTDLYRARWGKVTAFFSADGMEITRAAAEAIAKAS